MSFALSGVNSAAATPLNADLSFDAGLFAAHCRTLLDEGCHGIALLGTTGEANSFSTAERMAILEAALRAGVAPGRLVPGTGVAAGPETVALTRHALANGVTTVVMLPPFYYKGVTDDGLFDAYARIVEAVGDDRLRVILYQIPQMSGIDLGSALVARLVAAFPATIVGMKDSSGNLARMTETAAAHPRFAVLAGADPLLQPLLLAGGAGCITATSNLVADSLRVVFDAGGDLARPGAADAQARIGRYRDLSNSYTQIPAIKAMLALKSGHDGWRRVRPPLVALDDAAFAGLRARYAALDG